MLTDRVTWRNDVRPLVTHAYGRYVTRLAVQATTRLGVQGMGSSAPAFLDLRPRIYWRRPFTALVGVVLLDDCCRIDSTHQIVRQVSAFASPENFGCQLFGHRNLSSSCGFPPDASRLTEPYREEPGADTLAPSLGARGTNNKWNNQSEQRDIHPPTRCVSLSPKTHRRFTSLSEIHVKR